MGTVSSWGFWCALALVGAVAFGLRAWSLTFAWGLPRGRPDEEIYLLAALKMFGAQGSQGLLERGCTEGFALVVHALLGVYAHALTWWHAQEVDLGCLFALDPTRVLLVPRMLSVAAGTLAIVPTALVARRLVASADAARTGVAAAFLLATNYLHGRDSHFGVPDAALTFALVWSLWAIVRFNEDGRARHALLAGLFTGVAIAVKWTALFAVPMLAGSLLIAVWRRGKGARVTGAVVAAVTLALTIAVFLVLDPSVFIEPTETYEGLFGHAMRYEAEYASHTQDPREYLGYGIVFHSRVTVPIACGWLALGAAVWGLASAFRRAPAAASTCAAYVFFLYVVAFGATRMLWVRYCVPVTPAIAALAAAGLVDVAGRVARAIARPGRRMPAFVALVAATAAVPAARLVTIDRLLGRADTRQLAGQWMLEHAPAGATLVPEVAYTNVYGVEASLASACLAALPEALRTRTVIIPELLDGWKPDTASGSAGWGAIADRALIAYWAANIDMNPDYFARGFALLRCGERNPLQWLSPIPEHCLEQVAAFHPGGPGCDAVLDLFDQFFVPYAGFRDVERPGPEVVVYRYACKK